MRREPRRVNPLHDLPPEPEDPPFEDIWEQWEDEPDKWYGRFRLYLSGGPGRKIVSAFLHEYYINDPQAPALTSRDMRHRALSDGWYQYAHEWQWTNRANAYDKYQNNVADQLDVEERLRARASRRTLMSDFGDEVHKALPKLVTAKPSWNGLSMAMKVLTETSRQEFDDNPVTRTESTITVKEVQEMAVMIINVFNEVNSIDDPDQRRDTFARRLEALTIQDGSAIA